MGFALVRALFANVHPDSIALSYNPPQILPERYFEPDSSLYNRHVVIERDYIDTIVSGYLYHQSVSLSRDHALIHLSYNILSLFYLSRGAILNQ